MNLKSYISLVIASFGTIGGIMNFGSHGAWFTGINPEIQLYQWQCLIADLLLCTFVILISIFIILFDIALAIRDEG
jgi:hypothetical protein